MSKRRFAAPCFVCRDSFCPQPMDRYRLRDGSSELVCPWCAQLAGDVGALGPVELRRTVLTLATRKRAAWLEARSAEQQAARAAQLEAAQ